MNSFLKSTLFFLTGVSVLISCKKNEDDPKPVFNNNKELLTKGRWSPYSFTYGQSEVLVQPCIADDTVTLFKDNTYTVQEGLLVCEEDTVNYTSEYILTENDTHIEFIDGEGSGYIHILTDSLFVIKLDGSLIEIYYKLKKLP